MKSSYPVGSYRGTEKIDRILLKYIYIFSNILKEDVSGKGQINNRDEVVTR